MDKQVITNGIYEKGVLMKKIVPFIAGIFAFIALGVNAKPVEPINPSKPIKIMVSILPQVDFVERIGGDKVRVTEMIPPGFSPATYNPSPAQLRKLQDADIYFRIGHIPFEKAQMSRLQKLNTRMKVVDTSKGIKLLTLAAHHHHDDDDHGHKDHHDDKDHHDHKDHDEGDKHEAGNDPHIWLSPKMVETQASHIFAALVKASPENTDLFTKNYNQLINDLDDLDKKLTAAFAPIKGQTILVFHPAFGYLAHAYGFQQESIETEGKDPTPAQLQKIIGEAKKDAVKVIFVQAQFSTKSAKAVASEIGGAVVQIDPLAKDYFSNLEQMAQTIVTSLK